MWQIKSLSKALLQTGEPTALNPLNFSTQLQDPDHWVAILMQHDSRTPLGECMLGYFMCCPSSKDQTLLFLPAAKHAGGAGGSHPLAWTKLDGSLGLHLPPNSLIFAELVQEKSGLPPHHSPSSVQTTTLHIIDAAFVGGFELQSLDYADRLAFCTHGGSPLDRAGCTNLPRGGLVPRALSNGQNPTRLPPLTGWCYVSSKPFPCSTWVTPCQGLEPWSALEKPWWHLHRNAPGMATPSAPMRIHGTVPTGYSLCPSDQWAGSRACPSRVVAKVRGTATFIFSTLSANGLFGTGRNIIQAVARNEDAHCTPWKRLCRRHWAGWPLNSGCLLHPCPRRVSTALSQLWSPCTASPLAAASQRHSTRPTTQPKPHPCSNPGNHHNPFPSILTLLLLWAHPREPFLCLPRPFCSSAGALKGGHIFLQEMAQVVPVGPDDLLVVHLWDILWRALSRQPAQQEAIPIQNALDPLNLHLEACKFAVSIVVHFFEMNRIHIICSWRKTLYFFGSQSWPGRGRHT